MPDVVIKIETREDYEKATVRLAKLSWHIENSAEEREVKALVEAIMEWVRR